MENKVDLHLFPEFASEIVLGIPYAYWLHRNNRLGSIYTSKGMRPFYYFTDNVHEIYERRTLDNNISGLNSLPNTWIHHCRKDYGELTPEQQHVANGVLNYEQWEAPPYVDHYKSDWPGDTIGRYVVINHAFNVEYKGLDVPPIRCFSLNTLERMFDYFRGIGMSVVYKRPMNTEFALDDNEQLTRTRQMRTDDYDLASRYDNVFVFHRRENMTPGEYNDEQLRIFASADGFVTTNGGGGILCSYFGKPVVMYVPDGKELRPGYLTNSDSYIKKLSGASVYPVFAQYNHTKQHNYDGVLETIGHIWPIS
jgi:hypothetical protein